MFNDRSTFSELRIRCFQYSVPMLLCRSAMQSILGVQMTTEAPYHENSGPRQSSSSNCPVLDWCCC